MGKLVQGVGVYRKGKWKGSVNGLHTHEYNLWKNMLERCYSERFHKTNPTYEGCSVSDNFKDFQYFAEWCNRQIGFGLTYYNLDKDILQKGNQIYSENSCVFIPREVNLFLTNKKNHRGIYPLGVQYDTKTKKFQVYLKFRGITKVMCGFSNEVLAFEAYREEKKKCARILAEDHREFIDARVYQALLDFNLEITD